jgi:putative DNA primase/helicase
MNDDILSQVSRRTKRQLPSDSDLARGFVAANVECLRYLHATGQWFFWDDSRWRPEPTLKVLDLAQVYCEGVAATFRAKKLADRRTIDAVVHLARADRRIATEIGQWDANPWLLCCPDGTIDLRTGELLEARREDLLTVQTRVTPGGTCKIWRKTVLEIFGGDKDLVHFVQRWFGLCLTGEMKEHKFVFAHGGGGNGKTLLVGTVAWAMGDYADMAPMETFMSSRGSRHPTELAALMGRRLIVASETQDGQHWATIRIKQIVGGDPISARYMRRDFFTFQPACKLTIFGNHKPDLASIDEAWKRRMLLLPFLINFSGREDRTLAEKLRGEAPGILAWCIEGLRAYLKDGLQPPEAVTKATEEYFAEVDRITLWVNECCISKPFNIGTPTRVLYRSWCWFCEERHEPPRNERWFSNALAVHYTRVERTHGTVFLGLGLPMFSEDGNST